MEFFDLDYSCQADESCTSETSFDFGSYQVQIVYTPGHSDCNQCIRLTENIFTPDIVFTGEILIRGYSVITRLPSGSKKRLQYRSCFATSSGFFSPNRDMYRWNCQLEQNK